MSEINTLVDALGLFLAGGSSNRDPDLSLGGQASSTRVRGMGPIIDTSIPAIRVDNVFPACGEGSAILAMNGVGDLVFTPPGASAGTPVAIAAGESKVLSGVDRNKAIRVFREVGLNANANFNATLELVDAQNGVMSMKDVTDAQRAAGVTTYRGWMLKGQSIEEVLDIRLWMPPVAGSQAVFSLGVETAVGDTIQTVADELTAPTAVTFTTPTTEGSALVIASITPGAFVGLWIRKVFPAVGVVTTNEEFRLAMKYLGA